MIREGETGEARLTVKHGDTAEALALEPGDGQLSVGVGVRFELEAFDEAGPIGSGEHTRAIIAAERLVAGAKRRKA